MVIPSGAMNLPSEALITHLFGCDVRSLWEFPHFVRDDTQNLEAQSARCCETSSCRGEALRIISAQREFSAIVQRDHHSVQTENIIKPTVRCQMNSPTVPPANANRLASDDLRKRHFFADQPYAETGLQSFFIDLDRQLTEHDRANEKD